MKTLQALFENPIQVNVCRKALTVSPGKLGHCLKPGAVMSDEIIRASDEIRFVLYPDFYRMCAVKFSEQNLSLKLIECGLRTPLHKIESLLIPVCEEDHWILLNADVASGRLSFYDSFPGRVKPLEICEQVAPALESLFPGKEWSVVTGECPVQTTLNSCGWHLCRRLLYLVKGKDIDLPELTKYIKGSLREEAPVPAIKVE